MSPFRVSPFVVPPEYVSPVRGVLSAQAGIHPCCNNTEPSRNVTGSCRTCRVLEQLRLSRVTRAGNCARSTCTITWYHNITLLEKLEDSTHDCGMLIRPYSMGGRETSSLFRLTLAYLSGKEKRPTTSGQRCHQLTPHGCPVLVAACYSNYGCPLLQVRRQLRFLIDAILLV